MVNLDNVSFIEDSRGKKAVILSLEVYEDMQDKLEELEDIKDYIKVKNNPDEEMLPHALVEKLLLCDESKIKLIREYRKLSVTKLASLLGISEAYLSQIENNKRKGNIKLYKKLAQVLQMDLEILV